MQRLSKKAAEKLQNTMETLTKKIDSIPMKDLPGVANDVFQASIDVETVLKTIDDRPIDTAWVPQATRELAGIGKACTPIRDELKNNLAKLTELDKQKAEVEKHLARERQELAETNDPEMQHRKA